MPRTKTLPLAIFLLFLVLISGRPVTAADAPANSGRLEKYAPTPEELQKAYERAAQPSRTGGSVFKMQIQPHWFHDNTRFWYRNDLRGGAREFILVDAERGSREPAFDHVKLALALGKAAGADYHAERLPFDAIEFIDGDKAIRFRVGTVNWKCNLDSYECSKVEIGKSPREEVAGPALNLVGQDREELADEAPLWTDGQAPDAEARAVAAVQAPAGGEGQRPQRSPDGKWTAFVKDSNVYVRPADGKETALSTDGKTSLTYGMLRWSPDSKVLVAFRIEPGEEKEVYLIESSPREGGRAKLHTRPYPLPGDRFTAYELNLFDVAGGKQIKPEVERVDFGRPVVRWKRDGRHFTYEKVDRGHQRFRIVEIDAHTGSARNLIDEKSQTFLWTAHQQAICNYVNYLDRSDEVLYASERDGWRHMYLIDAKEGTVKNQITRGDWVVRAVDRVDETNRQIWFQASGKNPGQDPYFHHFYRINFDGNGLVALTEGDGDHAIQYSPDRKYLVDTYSRVDQPPIHELRRTSDGTKVCDLEKADIEDLKKRGWEPPEVFVAKGRDGKTDIWGIVCRPARLNATKRYPVIESIYAGPHDSFVPKRFQAGSRFTALTELGFVVVQIDGMGTANRSKAFHDVCWHNLKDAGFPDRILWHQALARKYPWYDISCVGIYGTSAGGQSSTGALLFHPEFYQAAVSACGCHDNRMDKASWNEQWMGYPVGPQYAESSNITHAGNLRGKLLLIVGEMDTNVPPESTYRLVDALIKAGKDFEFLAVPGMGHSNGGAYGNRRLQDFFVRHLHGVQPPDRNAMTR